MKYAHLTEHLELVFRENSHLLLGKDHKNARLNGSRILIPSANKFAFRVFALVILVMLLSQQINALKGIHPGLFLERELQKRQLKKGRFAMAIGEYPQTLTAITKGTRDLNTTLALKIEHELDLEEGFLMILQTFYEISEIKKQQKSNEQPDLSKIRKSIFWDTRIENIDWQKQKEAVIKRIFDRGNDQEKEEIIRFYGQQEVDTILAHSSTPK